MSKTASPPPAKKDAASPPRSVKFDVPPPKMTTTTTTTTPPSKTGVLDWEEVVDSASGRVFFHSIQLNESRWGLPLESLAKNDEAANDLRGWCLHVDPASKKKFYANEVQAKAQWTVPQSIDEHIPDDVEYLNTPKSYAIQRQDQHSFAPPTLESGKAVKAPVMRRLTLRMLIQTLTLDKVICDREAFRAFQLFSSSFHAEENVLFYCVTEAFKNRGTKAADILGLDDLSKSQHKGMPRTQSHLHQIALDSSRAERMGTTLERVQMIREAMAIYERFLQPDASDWVCVDQKVIDDIKRKLDEVKADAKAPLSRDVFIQAQAYVFQNMAHDLLPRFLKIALAPDAAVDDEQHGSDCAAPVFKTDEVLRHHLLQLQKKPMAQANATANAFRSLFPSPRYAIEGREGSGLHPDSLTQFDRVAVTPDEGVIAKPAERKSVSLSQRLLRPFSTSIGRASDKASDDDIAAAAAAVPEDATRRNSTGMHRGTVLSGSSKPPRTRARSKSDSELDADGVDNHLKGGVDPVDLDAHVFSIPDHQHV